MTSSELLGADSNTYGNLFTFMGLPLGRDLGPQWDAIVMGVPYDLATSGRSGARYGPTGIRQASAQLRWEKRRWPWRFALSERLRVQDYGDLVFGNGDSDSMLAQVDTHAERIMAASKTLVTFGGDHFVTLPLLRVAHRHFGPLALLHFDAHTDTEASTAKYDHGAMFHHAEQEGLIVPADSVQIGIRTEYEYDTHPFTVLDASWTNNHSAEDAISRIEQVIGERPVYLSFDIDCLDPAFAPGTGTPVAGGVGTGRILQIIRGLGKLNFAAMDMMEVAPAYDHAELTSLAAATLVLDMLYLLGSQRG